MFCFLLGNKNFMSLKIHVFKQNTKDYSRDEDLDKDLLFIFV